MACLGLRNKVRFEATPQGTRYYGRGAQIGNAVRISPFQGFVEAAKALQKCRRLCPSGWARKRSRGLRLRHLHESSSFGAAVHRASKARTARIGIVKRRYQCTKRRPLLSGMAAFDFFSRTRARLKKLRA
jgi:hypothetical protein